MLRLAKRLLYRDKVLEHLGTLLVMYPRGRQFTDDIPGLRAVIRAHFDENTPETGAALLIAARVLTDLLAQLAPAERDAVAQRLGALDLVEMEPLVARQISRRPEAPGQPVDFATNLVGAALLMARRMVEDGMLDTRELGFFLEALDAALAAGAQGSAPASLSSRFGLPDKPTLWRRHSG